MTVRNALDIALTGSIIVIATLVIVNLLRLESTVGIPTRVSSPLVGKVVSAVTENHSFRDKRTLILFLRPGCRFCEESLPFYQRLSAAVKNDPLIKLAIATNQPSNVTQSYVKRVHLRVDGILDKADLPIAGTPTLALVNSHGIVERAWIGRLAPSKEDEVFSAISGNKTR